VRFRSLRSADRSTVLRFRRALFEEMGGHSTAALDRYGARFSRWYGAELRAGRLWGILAESETGRSLASGLAWLQPRHPSPRFAHRALPYLLQVYTVPSARRRGIAGTIVSLLVDSARSRGYPRVILHATPAGRAIYERLGFHATDEMRIEFPAEGNRRAASGRPRRRR